MKQATIVFAALAIAVTAAANASAQRAHPTLLATVKVSAKEFKFTLSAKTAKRGVVIFKVTNTGMLSHNFEISGRKTKLLSHGQSDTLRVTFLRKGHYPYKCTQPGHAAQGMAGVFTIT
jgi:plastocyanin